MTSSAAGLPFQLALHGALLVMAHPWRYAMGRP